MTPDSPPARLSWGIWGLGAVFYLIGFYHRIAPGVMTRELMDDFGLDAASLGTLSALYFYSYVAMQIPTGLLADRWGPRRLLAAGAFLAGCGTLLFAFSAGIVPAGFGRFLIGGSVAVAFVGVLKLSGNWFAPRQFALASGLTLCCGMMGAVFAGAPLRVLISGFGWRPVMFVSALFTFGLSAAIWIIVRDDPEERGYAASHAPARTLPPGKTGIAADVLSIFRYRNVILMLFIPGGIVGSMLAFIGLWGIPFLTTHYGMTTSGAAAFVSMPLIAWGAGGTIFGGVSDRIGRRKPLYAAGCGVVASAWPFILLYPSLPFPLLSFLLILVGFTSGCMTLSFPIIKESVPLRLSGTANGVCNMGIMSGPMILQPAVGWMLDRHWGGEVQGAVRLYDFPAYQAGFSLMIGWLAVSLILIFFVRETFCRQTG
jgi:MFS family permease